MNYKSTKESPSKYTSPSAQPIRFGIHLQASTCVHARAHTHTHARTHARTCAHTRAPTHARTCARAHARARTHSRLIPTPSPGLRATVCRGCPTLDAHGHRTKVLLPCVAWGRPKLGKNHLCQINFACDQALHTSRGCGCPCSEEMEFSATLLAASLCLDRSLPASSYWTSLGRQRPPLKHLNPS